MSSAFKTFLAIAALSILPISAHAKPPLLGAGGSYAASGPCAGVEFQIHFDGGSPNCNNGATAPAYTSFPGLTYSTGVLSGTGATHETAFDAAGVVVNFSSGVPRITSGGVTAEFGSENLILQSDTYSDADYVLNQSTIATTTVVAAPDGTNTAWKHTATGDFPTIGHGTPVNVSALTQYSITKFYHAGTNPQAYLVAGEPGTPFAQAHAGFNVTNCTVDNVFGFIFTSTTASATPLANGWCKASITFTTDASTTQLSDQSWVGPSGVACTGSCVGSYVYMWGGQLEPGIPSSYIPTTTAVVSRSSDTLGLSCSVPSTDFARVYYSAGGNQNAYLPATCPFDYISATAAWQGFPIRVLSSQQVQPIPAPAAAVGYNTLTFSTTKFTPLNVDMGLTNAPGFQWYVCNFNGYGTPTSANVTLNGDGSATIGAAGNPFNSTLCSSSLITPSTVNWRGINFGGGFYSQTVLKFTAGAFDYTKGWPATWFEPIEVMLPLASVQWPGQTPAPVPGISAGFCHHAEMDDFEYFGTDFGEPANTDNRTILDWYGSTCNSLLGSATTEAPASLTNYLAYYAQYHYFDVMWVPATATTQGCYTAYTDGVQVMKQCWSQLTSSDAPPPTLTTPWAFGIVDLEHFTFMLGSNNTNRMTVQSTKIWQSSIANNLYAGTAPPTPPVACPYVGYADGCSGANKNSFFKFSGTLASVAAQSGQTYSGTHPQPWNIAGFDYPVAYDTSVTLKDPLTCSSTCTSNIAHAVYATTGGPNNGQRLILNTAGVNYDIEHYDLSLHGCLQIEVNGATTGSVKIDHNKWVGGPNCNPPGGTANAFIKIDAATLASLEIKWNLFDGEAQTESTQCSGAPCSADPFVAISDAHVSGDAVSGYNLYENLSGRPIAVSNFAGNSLTYEYDVAYNVDLGALGAIPANHGEYFETGTATGHTVASVRSLFSTMIGTSQNYGTASANAFNAWLDMGSGGNSGVIYTQWTGTGNTMTFSKSASGYPVAGAVVSTGYSTFTNTTLTMNYIDGFGAGIGGAAHLCFFNNGLAFTNPTNFGSGGKPGLGGSGGTQNVSLRSGLAIVNGWGSKEC